MNLSPSTLLLWLGLATLTVSADGTATPATVTLGDLEQSYDGGPKLPSVTTDPPELLVSWRFVDPTAPPPEPVTDTVFTSIEDPLFLSYYSISLPVNQTTGVGEYVRPAGTARMLESVETVLVTWAKAASYPELAAADPTGWNHPVTLSIYDYNEDTGELAFLGEVTRDIHVPWRPLDHPYNGYAFTAHFDFPPGLVLPEKTMLLVSYNTRTTGFEPIGEPGPYDVLNIAVRSATPTTGTDVDPDAFLWVRNPLNSEDDYRWSYPANPCSPPMFRIRASETPDPGTSDPPVNAGTWYATATIDDTGFVGAATETFTILPAPVEVQLDNLTQIADGTPKSAAFSTTPSSLDVALTYDASPHPPSALGNYAVHAEITDPNHTGSADGTLWIGHNLESWIFPWIDDGSIPSGAAGPEDDPDLDGIINLLEYAWGLDPSSPFRPTGGPGKPRIELENGQCSVVFRKNTAATDLVFQLETSTILTGPGAWTSASHTESTISTADWIETVRATLSTPPDTQRLFVRLRVVRQ